MRHIETIIGSDLVELAALTNALNKREIGELRAIAAELKRESFTNTSCSNYNHLVYKLLQEDRITLAQLGSIEGIDPATDDEILPEETFRRILLTLIEFSESGENNHKDPNRNPNE